MKNRGFKSKAKRAWKVAELLCRLLKGKDKLRHREAVQAIQVEFGDEFLYVNRNGNPAISQGVLTIFELFTEDALVWAKHGRYWRRRREGDSQGSRMVRF